MKKDLRNHIVRAHFTETPYLNCDFCQETFDHIDHWTKHISEKHVDMFYQLKHWDLYDSKCLSEDKSYVCEFCSKSFQLKTNLTIHMRIHTGERPHECTECDRKFSQPSHLHTHMKTHTGEQPYSCDICSKSFALNGNLPAHKRTHTGEKPFSCMVCCKAFGTRRTLKSHMKTHNKEN